ncbi:MAG: hypothetical protein GXP48_05430 [Acidobacteria bacterium]|nr:hypothetical protein [Acidobacteriota bacterium]
MRAAGKLWRRLSWAIHPPVLALGGGGARGFAHIGFLEVLEREGFRISGIAGTSAGSVIGGMFLAYGTSQAVLARWQEAFDEGVIVDVPTFSSEDDDHSADHPLLQAARRFRDRVVISLAVNRSTMVDAEELQRAIDFLVPDVKIEELRLPFIAVATNLVTGEEVRLDHGSLRRAVQASSSIPGLVPPVNVDGVPLVDAGVIAEVPVAAARSIGGRVVAVDVSAPLPPYREGKLVLETLMRTGLMTSNLLRECQLRDAHIVVHPEVGSVLWSDWSQFDRLVECGRAAARRLLGLTPPLSD